MQENQSGIPEQVEEQSESPEFNIVNFGDQEIDEFLSKKEIVSLFGLIESAQLKAVIREMQLEAKDDDQKITLNQTFLEFLQKMQVLKNYEREKSKMRKIGGDAIDESVDQKNDD